MHLVHTKIAPPRLRPELMPRARLLDRLREARQRKLILITGPAGYGKTCLAGAWRLDLMEKGWRVAWLSLNRDDNELTRLVGYLAAALARMRRLRRSARDVPARPERRSRRSVRRRPRRRDLATRHAVVPGAR